MFQMFRREKKVKMKRVKKMTEKKAKKRMVKRRRAKATMSDDLIWVLVDVNSGTQYTYKLQPKFTQTCQKMYQLQHSNAFCDMTISKYSESFYLAQSTTLVHHSKWFCPPQGLTKVHFSSSTWPINNNSSLHISSPNHSVFNTLLTCWTFANIHVNCDTLFKQQNLSFRDIIAWSMRALAELIVSKQNIEERMAKEGRTC